MYIKFLNHGTGSAGKAAAYVEDKKDHQNLERAGIEVLQGDPQQFAALADSLSFKQKYTSAVIAFHADDKPTPEEIKETLAEFEKVAFAGLEKHQYHMLAVQHDEADGSKHVHILIPRVDLESGKSLNIAPPNWKTTFDPLRDAINNEKGWARPDDPDRQRIYQPAHAAYKDAAALRAGLQVEPDGKSLISNYIVQRVQTGHVNDRAAVVASLSEIGEITRQGKDYISIKPEGFDKAIRLKGAIYDEKFNAATWANTAREAQERQAATRGAREPITAEHQERAAAARGQLELAIAKRTEYNQQRYPAASREHENRAYTHEQLAVETLSATQREAEKTHAGTERGTEIQTQSRHSEDDLDKQITIPDSDSRGFGVVVGGLDDDSERDVGRANTANYDPRWHYVDSANEYELAGMSQWERSENPMSPAELNQIIQQPENQENDRARDDAFAAIAAINEQLRANAERTKRDNETRKRDNETRKRDAEKSSTDAHNRRREHESTLRETLERARTEPEAGSQWRERLSTFTDTVKSTLERARDYVTERIDHIRNSTKNIDESISGNQSRSASFSDRATEISAGTRTINHDSRELEKHVATVEKQSRSQSYER